MVCGSIARQIAGAEMLAGNPGNGPRAETPPMARRRGLGLHMLSQPARSFHMSWLPRLAQRWLV